MTGLPGARAGAKSLPIHRDLAAACCKIAGSANLRLAFAQMKGLSPCKVLSMWRFSGATSDSAMVKQLVSPLPWGMGIVRPRIGFSHPQAPAGGLCEVGVTRGEHDEIVSTLSGQGAGIEGVTTT